jgi:chromosome segregation ATPase
MQNRPGKFQSELARASSDLKDQEAKLQQTRYLLEEKKNERSGIDSQRHMLERTGDINRLMQMKQRGLALDKSITELLMAERECAERVESARRYVQALTARLDKLREEAASLSEKISQDQVPVEVLPQVKSSLRRVQMQIEALTGAES